MTKNPIASLINSGKKLVYSDALRTIGQILLTVGIFAILYLFLLAGLSLGIPM